MGVNQNQAELNADPNVLDTPPAGQVNIIVKDDKTLWGKFPDGTIHQFGGSGSALTIVGTLDPGGGNIDYPAAQAGDVYFFISDGTIGAPPVAVQAGEMLICVNDSAGGAGAAADFYIYQINISYATESTAGIIRLVTQAQIEAGADNEAAITTLRLYYLLQQFGLEWILTDEVRGRNVDGTTPLRLNTNLNPNSGGNQNNIIIQPTQSNNEVGATPSANSGAIEIRTLFAGSTVDGDAGDGGFIIIEGGRGGNASGTGSGGAGAQIGIQTGQGGNGTDGNVGGDLSIIANRGGNSIGPNGGGGASGLISIQSLNGGTGAGNGNGGDSGSITIQVGQAGNSLAAGGTGGAGGDLDIKAGDNGLGDVASGTAGNVNIEAGEARNISNGVNGSQQTGGEVNITAGDGNDSDIGFPGDGGSVNIMAGGGKVQALDGGAGSKAGVGGDITITSGNAGLSGVSEASRGGNITIQTGTTGSIVGGIGDAPDASAIALIASAGGNTPDGDGGDGGDITMTPGAAGTGGGATGEDGVNGEVKVTGLLVVNSVENNVNAGAGGGFANATQLTAVTSRVTVVGAANDSVKLPQCKLTPGTEFTVLLASGVVNALDVFPPINTHTINGAANETIAPGGTNLTFVYFGGGEWFTKGHL